MSKHRKKKTREDTIETARRVVEQAIGEPLNPKAEEPAPESPPEEDTRNPAAVALSKLGASKGGKARAERLTPEQRSEIARDAAKARWSNKK